MVVLIDTNIILDYLLKREPFYNDSYRIIRTCCNQYVDGYIALHTITTIWYLLRKTPEEQRRAAMTGICKILCVVGTTHEEILNALSNVDFRDFEDCVQMKCAKTVNADYIITRNANDFVNSEVPVISPDDFLKLPETIAAE